MSDYAAPAEAPQGDDLVQRLRNLASIFDAWNPDAYMDAAARIESDARELAAAREREEQERKRADMLWQECENLRIRLAAAAPAEAPRSLLQDPVKVEGPFTDEQIARGAAIMRSLKEPPTRGDASPDSAAEQEERT